MVSEYGHTEVDVDTSSKLFDGVSSKTVCWMSHGVYIAEVPAGFRITAHTDSCPVAGMECPEKNFMRCSSILRWFTPRKAPDALQFCI